MWKKYLNPSIKKTCETNEHLLSEKEVSKANKMKSIPI